MNPVMTGMMGLNIGLMVVNMLLPLLGTLVGLYFLARIVRAVERIADRLDRGL